MQRPKLFLPSAVWPVVLWILFAGIYAADFFSQRAGIVEHFQYTVSRIPSVMLYGSDTAKMLEQNGSTYGGLVGLGLGFVYLIFAYILFGIFALIRLTRQKFGAMLAFLIAILPIDGLAYIIHSQPRPRTAISAALVDFVGIPLWFAALSLTLIVGGLFILSFVYGTSPSSEKTV